MAPRSSGHGPSLAAGLSPCYPGCAPSCVGMCDVSEDDTFGKRALDPQVHLLQVG